MMCVVSGTSFQDARFNRPELGPNLLAISSKVAATRNNCETGFVEVYLGGNFEPDPNPDPRRLSCLPKVPIVPRFLPTSCLCHVTY